MNTSMILTNLTTGDSNRVDIKNIENKSCFSYIDNDGNNCKMSVYEDGICFFMECRDHTTMLNLRNDAYAKITTIEGEIKIDAKVVDFLSNDDILLMRYIINDEEREIKVNYRS